MSIQIGTWRVPEFVVGDRLAKAREDAGISQDQMAGMLGCSRRTIVRYEASSSVARSVLLSYHVATTTDLNWLEHGVASPEKLPDLDSNQEPIDFATGFVPRTRRQVA